jgi:hypothetical protein
MVSGLAWEGGCVRQKGKIGGEEIERNNMSCRRI